MSRVNINRAKAWGTMIVVPVDAYNDQGHYFPWSWRPTPKQAIHFAWALMCAAIAAKFRSLRARSYNISMDSARTIQLWLSNHG